MNSLEDTFSLTNKKLESPKSHRTLRKRRFRQLERSNIGDDLILEGSDTLSLDSTKGLNRVVTKNDRKSVKLNEKMLKKASATVDLIS